MLDTRHLLNGSAPDLTLRFFATFARFEFALKYAGCLQRTEDGEVAIACRVRLRNRLPANFFETVRASGAAATLIDHSPKNLFVQAHGHLDFGEQQAALRNTRELLDSVWRVRNNLFHGNKMYPADRKRDTALMGAALAVIEAVLNADAAIAHAYHEPQQFL